MSCPNHNCSHEVQQMCCVAKGAKHGPAPIPEEGKWVKATQISDISGAHRNRAPASLPSMSRTALLKKPSLKQSGAPE